MEVKCNLPTLRFNTDILMNSLGLKNESVPIFLSLYIGSKRVPSFKVICCLVLKKIKKYHIWAAILVT